MMRLPTFDSCKVRVWKNAFLVTRHLDSKEVTLPPPYHDLNRPLLPHQGRQEEMSV